MRLRHLVPSLSILAFTGGVAAAADAPAPAPSPVSIGGFVDTIGYGTDTNNDHQSAYYDFQAAAALRLGYKIDDKVGAKIEVQWNNGQIGQDATSYNARSTVYLQSAFVNYQISDEFSLTTGKFVSYAGWVSADADGLYRIQAGIIPALYGTELVGGSLNYAPTKSLGISLFVTNGLGLVSSGTAANNLVDRTNDNPDKYLSPALDVVYNADGLGSFNVEVGWDYHGPDVSVIAGGANATIHPKAYEALTLGFEALAQKVKDDINGDTKRYGGLAMINHTLPNIGKAAESVTLMGQIVRIDSQTTGDLYDALGVGSLGAGPAGTGKLTESQIALALLTNPTGNAKFGLNFEVAATFTKPEPDGGTSTNVKNVWGGIELIAVIP